MTTNAEGTGKVPENSMETLGYREPSNEAGEPKVGTRLDPDGNLDLGDRSKGGTHKGDAAGTARTRVRRG